MLHELKLNREYCGAVYWGVKNFEIRLNDRDYKVGDFIHFTAVDNDGNPVEHSISRCYYQIEYVLSDFCGLAENYVALSINNFKCFYDCCKSFNDFGIEACFGCTGSEIETDFNNRSNCELCIVTDPDETAEFINFASWIAEKRKKEQQGN